MFTMFAYKTSQILCLAHFAFPHYDRGQIMFHVRMSEKVWWIYKIQQFMDCFKHFRDYGLGLTRDLK